MRFRMTHAAVRSEKILSDGLYAISIYFGQKFSKILLDGDNGVFIYIILILFVAIQMAAENVLIRWHQTHMTLWTEIVMEFAYALARTLAFVLISFSVHVVAAHTTVYGDSVLVPMFVVFVGITLMKVHARKEKAFGASGRP